MVNRKRRQGFTLIELLVVISIIALLISILLPSLGKSRKAARMIQSMSNLKGQNVASSSYRDDMKGFMPCTLTYYRGGTPWSKADPTKLPTEYLAGWCTWSYGGKNSGTKSKYAGLKTDFDVEAADRPLNPYVYPNLKFEAPAWTYPQVPTGAACMDKNYPDRDKADAAVFKDPSDKIDYQQNWPNPDTKTFLSAYEAVGNTYQFNAKWWQPIIQKLGQSKFVESFNFGAARMAQADNYQPSRFVWVHDQTADLVVNSPPKFRLKNGYDDYNKSVMGFMDGHGAYLTVIGGNTAEAYSNDKYTFVFEDLRIK